MADMKITGGAPLPLGRSAAAPRAEQVRAAQRAFFDAALTGAPASATAKPAQPPTAQAAERTAAAAPDPTSRYPRPGSRLDIKV